MAVWRTRAYDTFGFPLGSYSHARGKVDLFADLVERAKTAVRDGDNESLSKIAEYVVWAAAQNSDELASAVDLAFFLPALGDPKLANQLESRMPEELLTTKRRCLVDPPAGG